MAFLFSRPRIVFGYYCFRSRERGEFRGKGKRITGRQPTSYRTSLPLVNSAIPLPELAAAASFSRRRRLSRRKPPRPEPLINNINL